MEQQPLVSVIVPTYNRHLELGELLESLSQQHEQRFEVIIVNDHGPRVDDVVRPYRDRMDIRVLNLEHNHRHVGARNRGVSAARGTYVLLCDDDDLLLPSHLERMLQEIGDGDLVYSDVEIVDFDTTASGRRPLSRLVFAYEYDLAAMRKFSTFVPSGCLYRRSLHDEIGMFDTDVYHYWDWDFFLRAAAKCKVKRVPVASVLYAFSQQGTNLSLQLEDMRGYLNKLSAKHGLGDLPTKNFFLLLEEPFVAERKAPTEVVWDGNPFWTKQV